MSGKESAESQIVVEGSDKINQWQFVSGHQLMVQGVDEYLYI